MNIARFLVAANFPEPWIRHGLAEALFFKQQANAFGKEYGNSKSVGGTEHWRYGSFLYWFKKELTTIRLRELLDAAIADPDPPMAGNVLKLILAHPNATEEMLRLAQNTVNRQPYYSISADDLEMCFRRRWEKAAPQAD
jgi:hypothetical protein